MKQTGRQQICDLVLVAIAIGAGFWFESATGGDNELWSSDWWYQALEIAGSFTLAISAAFTILAIHGDRQAKHNAWLQTRSAHEICTSDECDVLSDRIPWVSSI